MVDSLDEAVGSVVRALGEAGMLQDSVIVFSADNGGVPWGYMASRGINWPLRGAKSSPWEGGSRAAAFVWSPLLDKRRRVSEQLMHITDWLPTFYALAGGSTSDLGQLDGLDMWGVLSRDEPSQRSDVVYNIDPLWDYAAIRRDNFKIVVGSRGGGKFDQRFPIPGGQRPSPNLEELMERSLAAQTHSKTLNFNPMLHCMLPRVDFTDMKDYLVRETSFVSREQLKAYKSMHGHNYLTSGWVQQPGVKVLQDSTIVAVGKALRALYGKQDLGFAPDWRANTSLSCLGEQCGDQSCFQSADNVFLFDMDKDPCECNNLASTHKQVLDSMNKVLEEYRAQTVPPIKPAVDPASFPENHDGTWAPWVD
ncbi:hypothetical protein HPB52_006091 [Rhipicephalus sanguineus]|uniref:Sulfatase N-terminal domain-containing protein n=1 Tax=Rhipicephalus sanguineus TaxID=34632 RepID=A0A9D4PYL0_RHISA|nr:hypothetical protein HPB52_006091 [Rhipicephalus sanguineus]